MLSSMCPLVSVIVPTYNRSDFVAEAVQSVLNQTYENIETIVVDDGSTDNTREVLEKYQDKINYIYQQRSGRSKARNEGFRHSRGDYIAFLDSDDLWFPTKIEKQVEVLSTKADVGLVYVGVQLVDAKGNPCEANLSWDTPTRRVLYEDLMTHNVITGSLSSIMVLRECLDRVGLFDESMIACEDLDLYRRIARHYEFHKIDLPLVKVRIHGDNTQGRLMTMAKGWEKTISKISRDTPHEFEYYKNEAIIKNLFQIASLYKQDGRLYRFLVFCIKSIFDRPNWILTYSFLRDLVKVSLSRRIKYGAFLKK